MLTPPTYTAAAAMSPLSPSHSLPLPPTHRYAFLARSQERRYLLCPLCRSLAVCQTEPMPIQGMSNGLKILHSLCFLLFPMANKSREGLNQREKPGHMPCVQQGVQHPQSCSLIRDKNIFFEMVASYIAFIVTHFVFRQWGPLLFGQMDTRL